MFVGIQESLGRAPLSLWMPGIVTAYALVWYIIHVGTTLDQHWVTHVSTHVFIVTELATSLTWQIVVYSHADEPHQHPLSFGSFTTISATCLAVVYFFERHVYCQRALPVLRYADPASDIVVGTSIFALPSLNSISTATPFSRRSGQEVFHIHTLVDLTGYAIPFTQFEHIQRSATERELALIQASLDARHHQYLVVKEDMEQVTCAHHDLKHQVKAIHAELSPGRAAAPFAEFEPPIEQIGQQYHGGNAALDVIFTTRGRVCAAADINFATVADDALLGSMSPMDIATLLGNVLDNTVEASRRVSDPGRRLIELTLFQRGQVTVIHAEDWFNGYLNTDVGDWLTTTKQDTVRHGQGVESIQQTAR